MATSASDIIRIQPLGFPWVTADPFLACMLHQDAYPAGNAQQGPAASLAGRRIGQDFEGRDGWRMYHGDSVPGFPQHPHRGFETVTLVRRGLIDHSDSLGATARFGHGDVQWLTAGHGVVHAEMFPLVDRERPNPLDLFQIWLNLPAADKLAEPHFSMIWDRNVPAVVATDDQGRQTTIRIVAGDYGASKAPAPPPRSWAARADADVAIWTIRMAPAAVWTLPAARAGSNRMLYFYSGESLRVGGTALSNHAAISLRPERPMELHNGPRETELLLLQGRPIGEPVAQYGPFVMNTPTEIQRAFSDYRATGFGGWPWPVDGPVHSATEGRFARHADGRIERP